jgi:DNA-binding protein
LALFPEHNDKKLYGIIAAVDMSEMLKKRVLEAGFYVARIQDETFSLESPDKFQAKCF